MAIQISNKGPTMNLSKAILILLVLTIQYRSIQSANDSGASPVCDVENKQEPPLSKSQKKSIEIVNGIIRDCQTNGSSSDADCVVKNFVDYASRIHDDYSFEKAIREKLSKQLESYTCTDSSMTSSEPIGLASWEDPVQQETHPIQIMHERSTSKIHVIENFISVEECNAISDEVNKVELGRATVVGATSYMNIRKAMQTNVAIPWDEEEEGNLIARASRRIYDYTNHALPGLNIQEAGQSSLKYLHYSGRGRNDTEPDHYGPHCDFDCSGSKHRKGARVATMVMYCQTAEDGGHTNFGNLGVHIAAKPGDALFFSYIDPQTLMKDDGHTLHSGCPVYKGDKKIVTQWIRLGVDAEHPYNSFHVF